MLGFIAAHRKHSYRSRTHAGQSLDTPFHILRIVVVAIDDDQILDAPGNEQLAVKQETEISGTQPTVDVGLGSRSRIFEIAGGDAWSTHHDLADARLFQNFPVFI